MYELPPLILKTNEMETLLKSAYDPKSKSKMVLLMGNLADFPFKERTKSNGRIL
jgi:hypothetical protein